MKKKLSNFLSLLSYSNKNKNTDFLNKKSVFFIFILNIFILSFISLGISFQTNIINNPDVKISYQCRSALNNQFSIDSSFRLLKFYKNKHLTSSNSNAILSKELDPRCFSLLSSISKASSNSILSTHKRKYSDVKKSISRLLSKKNYIEKNYNTLLFEKMANHSDSIIKDNLSFSNVKKNYHLLTSSISSLNVDLISISKAFNSNPDIVFINSFISSNKKSILSDYSTLKNSYFFKKYVIEFSFLIPLFLFFFFRMKKFNVESNYIRFMINKNLFIVVSIYSFIEFFSIIWNYIPHVLLNKIILFFYSFDIPFVAYYLLIALFIFFLSKLIVFSNSKSKLSSIDIKKSFEKNKCPSCNLRVDFSYMNFCPNCSFLFKVNCSNCSSMKFISFSTCHICGLSGNEKKIS